MHQAGIRDASLVEVENAELARFFQVRQPGVGDLGPPQNQVVQAAQPREGIQVCVSDWLTRKIYLPDRLAVPPGIARGETAELPDNDRRPRLFETPVGRTSQRHRGAEQQQHRADRRELGWEQENQCSSAITVHELASHLN